MFRPTGFKTPRPRRLRSLSFNRLIPNILTLLALCAGLTAIRYGLQGNWQRAVIAILFAGILDALDGRIARLLHGTSKFGAELDSLSDIVSFGVAPAVLIYFWSMQGAGAWGWAAVLLFPVCCALRLARFNTMLGEADAPPYAHNFFIGIPAPAAAGLALLPMVASFETADDRLLAFPEVNAAVLAAVSFLMVSRVPTWAGKRLRVPHDYVLPVLLLVGVLAAFLVTAPWTTIALLALVYLASFPFSIRAYRRLRREADQLRVLGAEPEQDEPADIPLDE